MDLDISHYTTEEMLELLELELVNKETIEDAIAQEKEKHRKDKPLVSFLDELQTKLLETLPDEPDSTFPIEVKRGKINPDLKNTLTRIINIDSACRVNLVPENYSSDHFTFELTEPLLNVISMSLYSVEIPQSWYSTEVRKGTATFIFCYTNGAITTRTPLHLPNGNYTNLSLPQAFVEVINAGTTFSGTTAIVDPINGMLTIDFSPFQTGIIQIIWFDDTFTTPEMVATRYNSSLGWMLGFRTPITTCDNGIMSTRSLVDASGTKYIMLSLNDYKTNRLNRNIVSVNTVPSIPLKQPSYYNESVPQYRISPTRVHVIPSDPRTLTSKQIYTINSINDQVNVNQRSITYDGSDTFAKIPFKKTDWGKYDTATDETILIDNGPCKLFVDASGPLQLQMREYFGPVNITTMTIGLYDDKGNVLGLNGMDWSCTLLVKCLYQY
jgi:hypothetical protein